jgi:hypothetical protein
MSIHQLTTVLYRDHCVLLHGEKCELKLKLFCKCCVAYGQNCPAEAILKWKNVISWKRYITLPFSTFTTLHDLFAFLMEKTSKKECCHDPIIGEKQWLTWELNLSAKLKGEKETLFDLDQKSELGKLYISNLHEYKK